MDQIARAKFLTLSTPERAPVQRGGFPIVAADERTLHIEGPSHQANALLT